MLSETCNLKKNINNKNNYNNLTDDPRLQFGCLQGNLFDPYRIGLAPLQLNAF